MEQRQSAPVQWDWITRAWQVFSGSAITWISMQLLVLLFVLLAISPILFLLGGIGVLISREEWPGLAGLSVLAILSIPALLVLLLVGGSFLTAGLYKTAIRRARGEEFSVGDLFSAGDSFLGVLGYLIVLVFALLAVSTVLGNIGEEGTLINSLAALAHTITDMIIIGLTIFAIPIIVDRRTGVIEAIRQSVVIAWPYWPTYALLAFITEILSGLGVILCLVGILVTAHFQWTIPAVAYCDVFGFGWGNARRDPVTQYFPPPPPPPDFRTPPAPPPPATGSVIDWSTETPTLPLACPYCGVILNRISQYCSQCGTRIGGDPA